MTIIPLPLAEHKDHAAAEEAEKTEFLLAEQIVLSRCNLHCGYNDQNMEHRATEETRKRSFKY